jgi:5-formyltetrahydrofolate cyclo-ligase
MSSGALKSAKRELRARMKAVRASIDAGDRAAWSEDIVRRVLELPELAVADTVSAFLAFGSEMPTDELIAELDQAGKRVAVPLLRDGEIEMVAYRPGDPLETSSYGMSEPSAGKPVEPRALDLLITPGLAFDRRGFRLGFGGGFYDRYVRRTRPEALRVGIAFDAQLVDDVPHGPSDQRIDRIVTEDRTVVLPPRT